MAVVRHLGLKKDILAADSEFWKCMSKNAFYRLIQDIRSFNFPLQESALPMRPVVLNVYHRVIRWIQVKLSQYKHRRRLPYRHNTCVCVCVCVCVTDRRTDGRTPSHSIYRAMHYVVYVLYCN